MPYIILFLVVCIIILIVAKAKRNKKKREESQLAERINAYNIAERELFSPHFVAHSEELTFIEKFKSTYDFIRKIHISKHNVFYQQVKEIINEYENLHSIVEKHNSDFIAEEKKRCQELLSDIDGKSLDDQQQTVVVSDEDHSLVLAGAGSGKTLTIAGKVKYLCKEKGVSPEEILLIAFTRKSAEEMTDRIAKKLHISITATTFHKLGLDIITSSQNQRPNVLDGLNDYLHDYFNTHLLSQPQIIKCLIEYFAYYLNIPADMDSINSLGEIYEHEKAVDFETIKSKYNKALFMENIEKERKAENNTLRGERLKSIEEITIANFLFLHGVNYEYERLYPFENDDPTHKKYQPDFYLPDYDIYIEHFGINKEGKLPWLSPVEEQKYIEGIQWKRDIHKRNGTKLLETYSYFSSEGCLLSKLEKLLCNEGVIFREPNYYEIFDAVYNKESEKYFSEFIKLCATFITLFKSNGFKPDDLQRLNYKNDKYSNLFFTQRTSLFLQIIKPIIIGYEEYLHSLNSIDFSDMINQATDIIENGYQVNKYRYIIIDEFQDISVARYRLVKAILTQTGAKLLCVGDDWQSIYRFTGSDIAIFTNFEDYFGYTNIMRLEQTYRNSQQLIDEVEKFIMQNPLQMKKTLLSQKKLDFPLCFMMYYNNPFKMLKKVIDKIINEFGCYASIMLLGRTSYDYKLIQESHLFTENGNMNYDRLTYISSPKTPISFMTVHKSKGLEADNVVLLNFQNSLLGFPNKISDDPILELVLGSADTYPYAEERRLLYVALTRTRNRVFVLTDGRKPSEFLRDFHASQSVFMTKSTSQDDQPLINCPRCKTGNLVVRKNEGYNYYFVGCSNYPQCEYTVNDTSIMTNTKRCPACGGFLVKRTGPFGEFFGCTNYPKCNYILRKENKYVQQRKRHNVG